MEMQPEQTGSKKSGRGLKPVHEGLRSSPMQRELI